LAEKRLALLVGLGGGVLVFGGEVLASKTLSVNFGRGIGRIMDIVPFGGLVPSVGGG
jgi:hypothetical protein